MPNSKRTALLVVSIDTKEWKARGEQHRQQAKKSSNRHDRHDHIPRFASQQSYELSLLSEIRFTILAGEAFRVAGEWYDSAKAYALAAALTRDAAASASLYTEAALLATKLDISFAHDYYKHAVSQHCNALEFKSAALLQERLANIYAKKDNLESSLEEIQKASKFYRAAGMEKEANRALERAAYLMGKTGDLVKSSNTYKSLVMRLLMNKKTQIFNVPRYALRSFMLLFLETTSKSDVSDVSCFSEVQDLIDEICQKDCRLDESSEVEFMYDIMQAVSCSDIHRFIDSVYWFNEIDALDDLMLDVLERLLNIVMQANKEAKREGG